MADNPLKPEPPAPEESRPETAPPPAPETTTEAPPSAPSRRLLAFALIAAILAGIASALVIESGVLEVSAEAKQFVAMGRNIDSSTPETRRLAEVATASRIFGMAGALLGIALGLAGGLSRRSPGATAGAVLIGAALAGACGWSVAHWGIPIYESERYSLNNDLIASLLIHGALWIPLGLFGGLALGIGAGGRSRILRSILGGVVGALLGVVVYELLGALAFPTAETGQPLAATATTRVLAQLLLFASIAAGAGWPVSARR